MAKQALLFPEFNMRDIFVASTLERCCYFLLLPRREQDVASNTQNESRSICERLQASHEIGWWFIAVSLRYRVDISRLLFSSYGRSGKVKLHTSLLVSDVMSWPSR